MTSQISAQIAKQIAALQTPIKPYPVVAFGQAPRPSLVPLNPVTFVDTSHTAADTLLRLFKKDDGKAVVTPHMVTVVQNKMSNPGTDTDTALLCAKILYELAEPQTIQHFSPDTTKALAKACYHPDKEFRLTAVGALGRIAQTNEAPSLITHAVVDALKVRTTDDRREVKAAASFAHEAALKQCPQPSIPQMKAQGKTSNVRL
jgi:HEAT repeat protein